jgi:hypothetical protein
MQLKTPAPSMPPPKTSKVFTVWSSLVTGCKTFEVLPSASQPAVLRRV